MKTIVTILHKMETALRGLTGPTRARQLELPLRFPK
jgi:hypothetical protein